MRIYFEPSEETRLKISLTHLLFRNYYPFLRCHGGDLPVAAAQELLVVNLGLNVEPSHWIALFPVSDRPDAKLPCDYAVDAIVHFETRQSL